MCKAFLSKKALQNLFTEHYRLIIAHAERYRIGAVSKLTGLPVGTIRSWERRYGAVSPQRDQAGHNRRYGPAEVERLKLLGRLVAMGEAIGEVAALSDAALRRRVQRHEGAAVARAQEGPARVALMHRGLVEEIQQRPPAPSDWSVVAGESTEDQLLKTLAGQAPPDVLVVEASLIEGPLREGLRRLMRAVAPTRVVLTYEFAARRELVRLKDEGIRLVRAPADLPTIQQVVADALRRGKDGAAPPSTPTPVRYSSAQLARLRAMQSEIDCECPAHIAGLIESLIAFERYSETCEDRSEEDRALHRELGEGAARARNILETLVAKVLEHDGLAL